MPGGSQWRDRLPRRRGRFPTDRDWERSIVLQARSAPREPAFVSDGAGLPFALSALESPAVAPDPDDPAVGALAAAVGASRSPAAMRGWRVLARTDDEALFGRGRPPHLITVAVRREGRRGQWSSIAVTREGALRRTRDGIRASGWILDPDHPPAPEDTVIRMLVTEQTRSGGAFADRRLLAPDVFTDDGEVCVAMFVTPLSGVIQFGSRTPATPVRLALASPVGERRLVDTSVYEPPDRISGG